MKQILLTISGTTALMLASCINPDGTSTSGQNRFGYNGTTTTDTQPTTGLSQGTTVPAGTTNTTGGNDQAVTSSSTQSVNDDTIPIDNLPSNNTTTSTSGNTSSNNDTVASNDTTSSTSGSADTTSKPDKEEYLYGIPVPGRDGMVYSPYNKDAGYIDVRGMRKGALAEDPYTPGKLFRVP